MSVTMYRAIAPRFAYRKASVFCFEKLSHTDFISDVSARPYDNASQSIYEANNNSSKNF